MYLFFLLCPQWTDLVLSWYQSKTHALWVWGLDSAAVKCRNLGQGYTTCNPEYTMCQTMNKPKTHGGRCYKQIRVDKPRPANLSDRQTDRWITWGVKQIHSVVNYLKVLLLNSCCPLCPRANMDTIVGHKLYYVLIYHRTGLWETFRSDKKKKKKFKCVWRFHHVEETWKRGFLPQPFPTRCMVCEKLTLECFQLPRMTPDP